MEYWVRSITRKRWTGGARKFEKRVLATVAGVILVVSYVSGSNACSIPAIYNFGDSNSDTGARSAIFDRLTYPNGETFFGKPSGRICDGRLIIDFLAEDLGLPFLNAYLDSLRSDFLQGANFAVCGATIQPADGKLFDAGFNPLSLNIQLLQFEQFKDRTMEFYNQAKNLEIRNSLPRLEDFSNALYTLDCGQNDLHFWLESNLTVEQVKASIPSIINQFAMAIEKLYQKGARKFWIHNTGPIGCLPVMVINHPPKPDNEDENGCIKSFNEVAKEFNNQLKDKVSQLSIELDDALLIHVDIYSAKYTLISESKRYGFVSPMDSCNGMVTENKGSSCSDPSRYISWDGIHYTEAANQWIAKRITDGSFSDPPIFNLQGMWCGNFSDV